MSYFGKKMGSCISALLLLSSNVYADEVGRATITLSKGKIEGVSYNNVEIFKGIPYAKAPINQLRWRKPQPVEPWEDTLDASEYQNDCMQKPFPGDAAPLGKGVAEDCLYLNVWKPAAMSKPLPVVVWIYGGGFVNGGASPITYSGQKFAEQGVIFVSFNYRVGRFGFFAHPQLTANNKEGVLGNYGFMDQIAALKWVKNNIRSFGGDAGKVTIMGESAGGFSVHTLLTSPLAKGLFSQAIIQSGGGRNALASRYLDKTNEFGHPSAEQVGIDFAQRMGIHSDDPEALNKLRQLPAEQIVNGLNMATMTDPTYSGPIIDGQLVIAHPQIYYSANKGLDIPLLVGATDYEIGFPPENIESLAQALQPFAAKNSAAAAAAYLATAGKDPKDIAQAIASDMLMVEPARFVARQASKQANPVYAYRFSYVADSLKQKEKGAGHATDIPFAFNTVAAKYGDSLTDNDKAAAKVMNQYWLNFIKNGSPNGKGLAVWQPYNSTEDNLMIFSNKGAKQFAMDADPWRARLDLIEQLQEKAQ